MNEADSFQLISAVKQLQEMLKALIPLRDPYYARLAEQQVVIQSLFEKYYQTK